MYLRRHNGNALFLILIAVALFAALSYAITQSGRGSGSTTRETDALTAARIAQYGAAVQSAITRLKLTGGCSDTQISFESSQTGTQYQNTSAPSDNSCHVFSAAGGGVTFMPMDTSVLDTSKSAASLYGEIYFTGQSNAGVGTSPACADAAYSSGKDLIMFVPYLKQSACLQMAKGSGLLTSGGAIPQSQNISFDNRAGLAVRFQGVYANSGWCGMGLGNPADDFAGKTSGCFRGDVLPESDVYTYFQVLIAR